MMTQAISTNADGVGSGGQRAIERAIGSKSVDGLWFTVNPLCSSLFAFVILDMPKLAREPRVKSGQYKNRPCLGASSVCEKTVKGYSGNRLCLPCKKLIASKDDTMHALIGH